MEFPEALRYSAEHEWVAVEGDRARVGITDFAQDALGDIVYASVPTMGSTVQAGAACAEVESTKSVSDVYAPVSGTVVDVNPALEEHPELLNRDPYGEGWLFDIALSDPAEVDALLDAAAYRSLVES